MNRRWGRGAALLLGIALLVAACSSGDDSGGDGGGNTTGVTLHVPVDYKTISAAVKAAHPGDLVLVAAGVYKEAVDVETKNVTIRGLDRNKVILDGEFRRENGVRALADGVAVENLTARNYKANGFYWTGVTGYRGSYLNAIRNGDYGVYAYDATKGQFDHVYAAGSPDAGIYIGECYKCDALVTDVIAEHNGLGYSGTNAGGDLLIVNSIWRNNRAGIVPNSGSYEGCAPQRDATIVGNTVYANNQGDTPAIADAMLAMGNGILLAGGNRNLIERNLVYGQSGAGIGLVPYPEPDANAPEPPVSQWDEPCREDATDDASASGTTATTAPRLVLWNSKQNRVIDNVVSGSGLADLGVAGADVSTMGNCFSGNTVATTAPRDLQALAPCDGRPTATDWDAGPLDLRTLLASVPPAVDYRTAKLPDAGPQPNMPHARTAPARPATDVPMKIDLDAIPRPAGPPGS